MLNSNCLPMAAGIVIALSLVSMTPCVQARTQPDTGRVLEELQVPARPLPVPIEFEIKPRGAGVKAEGGGPEVVLTTVVFQGMRVFDEATLLRVLGDDYRGRPLDLERMQGLAGRITKFYHDRGYPFALAYLPPQTVAAGRLVIGIVEGRYGEVRLVGDEALAAKARPFLTALQPGEPIKGRPLERAIQLLGEQPGVRIAPTLSPGAAVGSGDLEVHISEGKRLAGSIGLDNHGNRHTGVWRGSIALGLSRLLTFGDQLTVGALLTDEELWYGQLGYELPLGASGLRLKAGALQTRYTLGGDFVALGADGSARVTNLGMEYPLLRSRQGNLLILASYHHKSLRDRPSKVDPEDGKSSNTLPLALRFDQRDTLAGGGLTWGTLEWTPGRLDLDANLQAADALTARGEGDFARLNLEVVRLQRLFGPFSLSGRFSGQWSSGNLDSSEGFGLGGSDGVRAYPPGEGYGDRGWVGQFELRWTLGSFTPYLFYDLGEATINADPWEDSENHRQLAGGGIGLRLERGGWHLDAAAAWRAKGGVPQADTRDDSPRFWLNLGYRF